MNIDQIIGKLMGDGSVGEERSALEAWKKEAQDNIKALEDIQKIAALSNTLTGYEDFGTDEAWEAFSSNMDDNLEVSDEKTKNAKVFSITRIMQIAAVLVITLGCVFVFNQYMNDTVVGNPESYTATVKPLDFNLIDGTQVTLDKTSDLKVIDERSVSLKGRAYFDVAKMDGKQFKIDLPVGSVTVLGTEFTIDAQDNTTELYVSEGKVQFELAQRTLILVEGDLVRVVDNEPVLLKGNENSDSWKNQRLIFRDSNMVEVVDALSRHFKEDIIIENPKAFKNCNVFNVFTNASLNEILNNLSKSHSLKFQYREGKLFIVSAKC